MAASALLIRAQTAGAQPDLPPPPPPPIGEPNDVPSLPPPPVPPRAPSAPAAPPGPKRSPGSTAAAARKRRHEPPEDVVASPEPAPHTVALTLNPLGLFWGRLSANAEVQLSPHHSFVAAPNALIDRTDRGGQHDLLSEGYGFASPTSASFGLELGYHYWGSDAWRRDFRPLRGWFAGPALLFGVTTNATVGDATRAQGYWGLALDVGEQEVLPGGFTAGVGTGLEFVRMAGTTAFVPRLLLQLGWSL
jgi:hypothetical protein